MNDLAGRIQALDRATALESAQFMAADMGADPDIEVPDNPILSDPLAHQDDLEDLAKLVLLLAAEDDPAAVELAIDSAGRRQFVLGGAELIALAVLIVGALQIVMSKGKISEETTRVEEELSDGTKRTVTTAKTTYGVSSGAAALLKSISPGQQ